jgi:hypothetical protein
MSSHLNIYNTGDIKKLGWGIGKLGKVNLLLNNLSGFS